MEIRCPQCQTWTVFAPTNPFRPFCSERCRLIDLGQWASESYRIPLSSETPIDESEDESETEEKDLP